MRPVRVTIDVPHDQAAVYDFLDVLTNHVGFTDHMLRDWHFSGIERGVGAKAQVTGVAAGRTDSIEMEVIEAVRPSRTVERNIGARGHRIGTGTYTLAPLPAGGTRISFEYAWQQAPLSERLTAPLVRSFMRRANRRALHRLAETLQQLPGSSPGTSAQA